MNIPELLNMSPIEVATFLIDNYTFEIPEEANGSVGKLMSDISNAYAFVQSLLMYAQIDVRTKRRTSIKSDIEDAIDKRDAVSTFCDTLKLQYNAVSRLVSIKQQSLEEARILGG
jgi:hypothetical protein